MSWPPPGLQEAVERAFNAIASATAAGGMSFNDVMEIGKRELESMRASVWGAPAVQGLRNKLRDASGGLRQQVDAHTAGGRPDLAARDRHCAELLEAIYNLGTRPFDGPRPR